ncbi:MAG: hypothetical protein ABI360_09590 [Allobranchiibius sp.]
MIAPEVPDLLSVAAQPAELSTRYERGTNATGSSWSTPPRPTSGRWSNER